MAVVVIKFCLKTNYIPLSFFKTKICFFKLQGIRNILSIINHNVLSLCVPKAKVASLRFGLGNRMRNNKRPYILRKIHLGRFFNRFNVIFLKKQNYIKLIFWP